MKDIKNIIETKEGNVSLGRHLKEFVLFSYACSNYFQTTWIKHKMNITIKQWFQKLHDNCEMGVNRLCKG
jgi:hypothetical protein